MMIDKNPKILSAHASFHALNGKADLTVSSRHASTAYVLDIIAAGFSLKEPLINYMLSLPDLMHSAQSMFCSEWPSPLQSHNIEELYTCCKLKGTSIKV